MAKEKLTVLIVEDQLVNREILKTILAADYDVLEAENGKEAFAVLRKGQPISAILTDIVMPVMDGYTLLNELGKSPFSSIPTIAITGEKDPDSEQKCLDLGAWDFVTKPYQPLTLLTRLKNVIVRSQFYLLSEMKTIYEHDPVTGLDNRSYFFKRTRELLADHPDKTFALVRFDVDHFQTYNSFWGEKEGDLLLQFIANEVRKVSEDYSPSTSSRINADVFCLCVPFDPISLNDTVEKERQIFADYRKDFRLSLTVGVYVISDPTEDVQKMYEYATLAAKEGKNNPLSPLTFYQKEMSDAVLKKQWIVNSMEEALATHQFEIYYQPKYSLMTEKPVGAEALIRWRHPKKGMLMPGDFIPVLEQNGFIGKIDYLAWETTAKKLHQWIQEGKDPNPISVNLSRIDMFNPKLIDILVGLVHRYEIPARLLQLEVTESIYMDNPELMQKTIKTLKEKGFTILMDDFGSGYSSLNTLKDIPVDILKIDMKFLSGNSDDVKARSILASMIRLAGWLSMPVIMEGVETEKQAEFLRGLGCNYAQGYLYGRPMPVKDYEKIMGTEKGRKDKLSYEKLPAFADALWSGSLPNELLFNSVETPSVIYQIDHQSILVLRANDAFTFSLSRLFRLDDHKEPSDQKCMTKAACSILEKAFYRAIKTQKKTIAYVPATDIHGKKHIVKVVLRYWGKNGTLSIIYCQYIDLLTLEEEAKKARKKKR